MFSHRKSCRRLVGQLSKVIVLIILIVSCAPGQTSPSVIEAEIRAHTSNLPFAMPAIVVPRFPDRNLRITDFGAVADGRTLNTKAFNDAIEKCSANGGGTVIVSPGTWLTGPIKILSNVNLRIERGALIQFSKRIEDFPLIAGLDGKSKRYIITPPLYAYR